MLRGTVTATQSVEVNPAAGGVEGGSAVVTKLPVKNGQQIEAGRVLLEVSGRPVFTLEGDVPVYRDLKPGADGDDVAQLQRALNGLGHSANQDETGYFGYGTKKALTAFYEKIGYDPRPAQPDGDSSVESAQEAVTAARRTVEDARGALAAAQDVPVQPPPSPSSTSTASPPPMSGVSALDEAGYGRDAAADPLAELSKQATRAEEDLRKAEKRLAKVQKTVGPMLPASEVAFLTRFPARVDSIDVRVGSTVAGATMTLSAGALQVRGYLEKHEKGLVRRGQPVEILSETTGLAASATVTSVADTMTAEQPVGADASEDAPSTRATGFLMVVKPVKALPSELAGQDVRLTVRAASTKGKTLAVPVSAISAGADGKTAVTVVGDGGSQRRVPVSTGTTGDGYVEIHPLEGLILRAGEKVITGVQSTVGAESGP
ncbi:peptidoglycan-binding protein [Streptomyces spongiicola]|uniref:peptidoglycan-binding protein n=1 Tax=Streptomyces spongiicola TaxID=1690221 RepID=UPI0033FE83BF